MKAPNPYNQESSLFFPLDMGIAICFLYEKFVIKVFGSGQSDIQLNVRVVKILSARKTTQNFLEMISFLEIIIFISTV